MAAFCHLKFEFLTVGRVEMVNIHHHAKFCGDHLSDCPDMAIYQFFAKWWRPTFQPMYCGQTAGREAPSVDEPPARCYNINNIFSSGMWSYKLQSTEVGLGRGNIVLDRDPAPAKFSASTFRPLSIVAKRLDGSRCHLVRR